MTSSSGVFEAVEIMNPAVNHDQLCTPFPFSQSDLYSAVQPGKLAMKVLIFLYFL